MFARPRFRGPLGAGCALLLVVVGIPLGFGVPPAAAGAAGTGGPPAAPSATPGLTYQSFIGSDFHRVASDTGFVYDGAGAVHLTNLSATDSALVVKVDLPQDAVIRELNFYFVDNDGSNLTFSLVQYVRANGTATNLYTANTGGFANSANVQRLAASSASGYGTVQNAPNAYWLQVVFGVASSAQQLIGAQVGYLPPANAASPASASFSGYDFHPRGSASDFASAGAGKLYATSLAAGDAFVTRPNLPQGAQITRVEFDFVDNTVANLSFALTELVPNSGTRSDLVSGSSQGLLNSQSVRTLGFDLNPPVTVDNAQKTYQLSITPGSNSTAHQIAGARVVYTPGPPAIGRTYQTFTGSDFLPRNSTSQYADNGSGGIYVTSLDGLENFAVHFDLAQGLTIFEVTLYFVDSDPADLTFFLYRYDLVQRTVTELTSPTSTAPANSAGVNSLTAISAPNVVDNGRYAYQFNASPNVVGQGHQLVGVRVAAGALTFLPFLQK
jgi:hypothetical protein